LARACVDHLVVATAELDAGAAWLASRLGTALAAGGRHAAMGTHNRLLRLGPSLYLELIAVDPAAPPPARPRWFGLDDPAWRARIAERPRLIHWVARCDDVPAAASLAAAPGDILDLARGDFRWRINVPADGHLPEGGLLPSLIEWKTPVHPADRLPDAGCTLMKLEGFHPAPERLRAALAALGLETALALFPGEAGEPAALLAFLKCPAGLIELD